MIRQALAAFAIASFATPIPTVAQDYQEGQEYPPPQEPQVDVSVDLAAPGVAVSFDTFHEALAPYGEWVVVAGYGRVWRPHVAVGWRPYYYGRWVWSDEGWLWVSDEPWGWGPYHYGRWSHDPYGGWFWVPGYQWAPAWVSWRFSGTAIGWAPLFPGVSVYVTSYPVFYSAWTFVPCNRFHSVPVYSAAYAPAHVPSIFHGTSPAPPRSMIAGAPAPAWGGPSRGFVEHRVGHSIAPVRTMPVASPGQAAGGPRGGAIPVFRPEAARPPAPGASPSRPDWGPTARPGWGAPGHAPAPIPTPGGRPSWGAPPPHGSVPPAPGPRGGGSYSPTSRGGPYGPAPTTPHGGGSYGPAPGAPHSGGSQGPGPSTPHGGGSYGPAPGAPHGGGSQGSPPPTQRGGGSYRPGPQAPRGGSYSPAPAAPGGGGHAEPPRSWGGEGRGAPRGGSAGFAPRPGYAPGRPAAPALASRGAAGGRGGDHRR